MPTSRREMGALSTLPPELLEELLEMRPKEVRLVCKAMRDVFDGFNDELVFVDRNFSAIAPRMKPQTNADLVGLFMNVVRRSPRLTKLRFGHATAEVLRGLGSLTTDTTKNLRMIHVELFKTQVSSDLKLEMMLELDKLLERCSSLEHLHLAYFDGCLETLLRSVKDLTGLRQLDLSNGRIKKEVPTTTTGANNNNNMSLPTLTSISVTTMDMSKSVTEALFSKIRSIAGLRSLTFKAPYANKSFKDEVVKGLGGMTNLRHLTLRSDMLSFIHFESEQLTGEESVTACLANELKQLKKLKSLDLRWNCMGIAGSTVLAPAIGQLTALTSLDMGCNDLRNEGSSGVLYKHFEKLTGLVALWT